MRRLINMFRGSVKVMLSGMKNERILNLLSKYGIIFWDIVQMNGELELYVHRKSLKRLIKLCVENSINYEILQYRGAPHYVCKVKKRFILASGLAAVFVVVWTLSLYIWDFEVIGNNSVSDREILTVLEELGIRKGTFILNVSSERIANKVLLEIPQLSWFAVNTSGSKAYVLVRERTEKPDVFDESEPSVVYAYKSGEITKLSVLNGVPMVAVGDVVEAGQILVSGVSDSLSSGKRSEHAAADVIAKTCYDLSAQIPLKCSIKNYTGNKEEKTSIIVCGKRINLFTNSRISYEYYDKMTLNEQLAILGESFLPVSVVRDEYVEYEIGYTEIPQEQASEILRQQLTAKLQEKLTDGEILHTSFEFSVQDGIMIAVMHAECSEQIAAERFMTPTELSETYENETET